MCCHYRSKNLKMSMENCSRLSLERLKVSSMDLFGELIMKKGSAVKSVDSDNYYCKVCFQEADKKVLKCIYKGLAR